MDNLLNKCGNFFNILNVGLYRSTLDGKFIEVNPALVKISGLESAEELLKHNVIEIYRNPENRKEIVEKIKKEGSITLYSFPARNFKGENILTNVSVIFDKGGNGVEPHLDGVVQDITELEESKDKLSEMTIDIFVKFYARYARDSALNILCSEVYLAGGISNSLKEPMKKDFMKEFAMHRHYKNLLKKIGVSVITNSDIGLIGAGAIAAGLQQ
mgnify:CR=1 FL=1